MPRCSLSSPRLDSDIISCIMCAEPSTMAASTTVPLPVCRALRTPASRPMARYNAPPPMSPIRVMGDEGASPPVPLWYSAPDNAM
ncbi:hypothetical protein D3C85_1758750 [compost metagenome]